MEAEEFTLDAETQPLEFALVVCDIFTDQGIDPADAITLDPQALTGGFQISLQFGDRLDFTLVYDEELKKFIGSVSLDKGQVSARLIHAALLLNREMPDERRFSMDSSGALNLQESWSAAELDASTLAAGLRQLVEFMHLIAVHPVSDNQPTAMSGHLRV